MNFSLTIGQRRPVNPLEAHLVEKAKRWAMGRTAVPIKTLAHFQNALQIARDHHCSQDRRFRPSSVSIRYLEDGPASQIWISSADQPDKPSVTIGLTPDGVDHQEIQDSLLIPLLINENGKRRTAVSGRRND